MWPIQVLQNLARYVFQTRNPFGVGHHMNLNSPIDRSQPTDIRAVLFTQDPVLKDLQTPNGKLTFLQMVGITLRELDAVREWNTRGFLEIIAQHDPMLVTSLVRKSYLSDPRIAKTIRERTDAEGSSQSVTFTDQIAWTAKKGLFGGAKVEIELGANTVEELVRMIRGRLLHQRAYALQGQEQTVEFRSSATAGWKAEGDAKLVLDIPAGVAQAMIRDLRPQRGTYTFAGLNGVTFRVVPTLMRDQDGNVVSEIG
jgi:hypothetical protein